MRRTRSNTGLASLSFGGCSPHLQVHSPFACLRKIRSQWSLLCALCAILVCIASLRFGQSKPECIVLYEDVTCIRAGTCVFLLVMHYLRDSCFTQVCDSVLPVYLFDM